MAAGNLLAAVQAKPHTSSVADMDVGALAGLAKAEDTIIHMVESR